MSAAQTQMITALGKIEQALQDLRTGVADYQSGYRPISRASIDVSATRPDTLEQTVGHAAINDLIVQRLRALGLGAILERARTPGTIADLPGVLTSKIRAHVP